MASTAGRIDPSLPAKRKTKTADDAPRLGSPQMAFVRAWAEGLDPVIAWNRYLYVEGTGDARRARGELQRLLDSLRALARAHGRPEVAVLLRRDPQAIPDRGQAAPSLEEFAATQPPDYYTEAELVALYQEAHGRHDAQSAARRRERLRARLLAALQWLETLTGRVPQPSDATTSWLDERVAARLTAVGILTLNELRVWIASKGFNWHRGIPRLGPQGAARIVGWLREHEASLGALPSPALVPRMQVDTRALTPPPSADIVPIERFAPPSDRDGAQGTNRALHARCRITAANDHEAVQAWLRLRVEGSHTWRAYRKEAERFLLWAVMARRKALSSLDGADCMAYRDFLAAPGAEWVGPRHMQRWSSAWRPFEGALSVRSQSVAITIVRSLCAWLVRRHYLDSNPWDDVPARPDAPSMPQLRALSERQWTLVEEWMGDELTRAPSPALHRLRFLLEFGRLTGLRLAELATAKLGWLRLEPLEQPVAVPSGYQVGSDVDGMAWSIMVLGKRSKWREVPLPDPAVQALRDYLVARGLGDDPLGLDPKLPLVAKLSLDAALSPARIYEILVAGFERCATAVWERDKRAAERIREASTHWLRHTYGAHSAARGVPQDVLQANLGHESLATTSIYVNPEKVRKHRAMQAAFKMA
jgi:site-specific recombinase XerD